MVSKELLVIETYSFIQNLFEDLTIGLSYTNCKFQGSLDYIYITVHADPVDLKNNLFLVFFDFSKLQSELNIHFSISHIDDSVKWIFRSPTPIKGLKNLDQLEHWKNEFQKLDDNGFFLELQAGPLMVKDLPFDRDKAKELYLDDQLIDQVLVKFIERCGTLLKELHGSILDLDRKRIFLVAHTIKGSARNVFAIQISSDALRLEKIYEKATQKELLDAWESLNTKYINFLDFLGFKHE